MKEGRVPVSVFKDYAKENGVDFRTLRQTARALRLDTIQGDDGKYYRVYVGADGIVYTEEITVSAGEIAAGQTSAGQQIVETNANIKNLNAQNIKAASAIIDTIVTSALTAGKITATDALIASATIPTLYATAISAIGDTLDLSANQSITLMVGKKSNVYRQDDLPEDAKIGDLCIQPLTGKTYQCSAVAKSDAQPPTFALDGQIIEFCLLVHQPFFFAIKIVCQNHLSQ